MGRLAQRIVPAAGLLVAVFATAVEVRVWLAERSLSAGRSAQRQGNFSAAATAYGAASGRGNADAAIERARLELLRREWDGAGASLREAMALAPARGFPHLLRATLEIGRPGEWDGAREERILAACRAAVTLEPGRVENRLESAVTMLRLVSLRRAVWDPARTRDVTAEAVDAFAEAAARDPEAARTYEARMIAAGGDPGQRLDAGSRRKAVDGGRR